MTENIKPLNIKNKILPQFNKTLQTNKQKQCNFQGSSKTLNRSYSVEHINIETKNLIANFNLADLIK